MKRVTAVLLAVLLLAAVPVLAQMTGARLSGTVKDPTGAVVTDAKVTVTNQATGISQTTNTGSTGIYIFRGLQPGTYDIKAEREGFQTVEAKGLILMIGQDIGYDLALKVGAHSEVVNVTVETPLVESQKAQVDTIITESALKNMPLDSRYFLDLLFISTPGVTGNVNTNLGEGFSVNGQRGFANSFNLDGVNHTNSTLQSVRSRINIDSIQEFQILTHQFEPQYGNASGAVVNVQTKGGTNDMHGTAYTFIRRSALDAFNPYQKSMDLIAGVTPVKPDNYRNVYGGSFGGPIKKNKLFFFGSYEYEKERGINKILAPEEYNESVSVGPTSSVWSGRVDYTPSEKNTITFRYNGQRSNGIWGPGGYNMKSTEYNEIFEPTSMGVNWTRMMSATTVLEVRGQFAATLDKAHSTQDLQYPYVMYHPSSVSGKLPGVPFDVPEYNGQLVSNLSMTRGRHDIKIGGSYMHVLSDGQNPNFADGEYDFAFDLPFDSTHDPMVYPYEAAYTYPWRYIERQGKNGWHVPEDVYAFFAQDKWNIKDNLVLTYGLRWDYENFFTSVTELGTLSGKVAQNATRNFSPRISLAYSPTSKTVFRGGFGRFFSRIPLNQAALIIQNTVNTHDQVFLDEQWAWDCCDNTRPPHIFPPNPSILTTEYPVHMVSFPVPPTLSDGYHWANGNIDVLDDNLKYQYTDHYTFGVQQQINKQLAVNVDFVRILGNNLWTIVNRNAPDPFTHVRPNPDWNIIASQSSIGQSWYTAMEVTLRHTAPKHFFTLTYTRSKAVDDVRGDPNQYGVTCSQQVNIYGPKALRWCDSGLSINDLPHRFTFDGTYRWPYGIVTSVVIDAHPGYPWTVQAGQDLNGDGYTNDRPAGVGRSTMRGSRYIWTEMRFGREFKFKERMTWQPFIEMFNVQNSTNYCCWQGNMQSIYFGQPTGSTDGRRLQFGFRFAY